MLKSSKLAYLDARQVLGCFVEIVSDDEAVRLTLRRLAEAANGWDGANPTRPLL